MDLIAQQLDDCPVNNAATPKEAIELLRALAENMREAASVVDAAWQDPRAGGPWRVLAGGLEGVCTRVETLYPEWKDGPAGLQTTRSVGRAIEAGGGAR